MKRNRTTAHLIMKRHLGHKKARRSFLTCALFMAAVFVLTACSGAEMADLAERPANFGESGSAENQEDFEEGNGTAAGQESQENDSADKESAEVSNGSSMELPQPYAGYMEVLEQIRTEGRDPNGKEYNWNANWNFENNCFAIADVDCDGKQELLFNFNESYMGAMCEVVYEYEEETDTLREELVTWVSTDYYSNGLVKVEMSHNHGRDPEGRGIWPYMVYQYDEKEDSYRLVYTVDTWDGQVYEEGFPDELDVNGDKLLYCITVGDAGLAAGTSGSTDRSMSEDMPEEAYENGLENASVGKDGEMIFDWEEYSAWAESLMPEWSRLNVVYHSMSEDFRDKVENAYIQAAAYAAQADVWRIEGITDPIIGYYLLYDLDGDGSLELIASVNQGTGRYSMNYFYSLSDNGKVTELELKRLCNSKERDWIADFDIGAMYTVSAYQDGDGTIYYEASDYTRDGIFAVYVEEGFYYLKDGVVYQDSIRWREQFFHEGDGQEDEIYYYSMEEDADGERMEKKEITEKQYEEIREEYIKDMAEIRVRQNWIYFGQDEIKQGDLPEDTICLKLFEGFLGSD